MVQENNPTAVLLRTPCQRFLYDVICVKDKFLHRTCDNAEFIVSAALCVLRNHFGLHKNSFFGLNKVTNCQKTVKI